MSRKQVYIIIQDYTDKNKHAFIFSDVSKDMIGDLIIEGKTKQVFKLKGVKEDLVYVLSKDKITAGDGVKVHEMKGKAKLSTKTNGAIFEFLKSVGVKTHFIGKVSESSPNNDTAFVARNCAMIPIEWVTRRVATGSYLKGMPHVKEGYRFYPPKLETFFKGKSLSVSLLLRGIHWFLLFQMMLTMIPSGLLRH